MLFNLTSSASCIGTSDELQNGVSFLDPPRLSLLVGRHHLTTLETIVRS
jgi:hypothetical protein